MGRENNNKIMSFINAGQDWAPVTFHKHSAPSADAWPTTPGARAASMEPVRASRASKAHAKAGALDAATEAGKLETASLDMRQKIQTARLAKKLTQAQLAKQINVQQKLIADYESGKAVPDPSVTAKLSRALGVKLSGKSKGNSKARKAPSAA